MASFVDLFGPFDHVVRQSIPLQSVDLDTDQTARNIDDDTATASPADGLAVSRRLECR
jgi:hypothetical protein